MTLLRNATTVDGRTVDVRVADSRISAVEAGASIIEDTGEETHDLTGYLLLPALAEPHAHLDKALTMEHFDREFTNLMSAIGAWMELCPTLSVDNIAARARRAALLALAHGVTAIRSHVDVSVYAGLRGMEALVRVRDELRDLVDIQIVALNYPATGPVAGLGARERLREAIAMGADLVGCGPHADEDARQALEIAVDAAVEAGLPLDVHADENLRPDSDDLVRLIAVAEAGFGRPVTASHCTSLGILPEDVQARVAEQAAAAGVSIVTNPIANLYLQGRGLRTATPRGLTALPALQDAGVAVAAGGDNIQDPFIPVGKTDALVTAQYMVIGGHLAPSEAYRLVGSAARALMQLPPIEVAPGSPADLVAVRARSLQQAIATATQDRLVFRRGVLVSRTRVAEEVAP